MPISPADIAALKQKVKGDIDQLEAKLSDLRLEFQGLELAEKRVQQERSEQLLLSVEAPAQGTVGISFAEAVRRAVREFKDQTFSVGNVEAMLKAQRAHLPKNNLRTRIAVEVKDMVRKKQVMLVEKGAGHVPHKYRRALDSPKEERVLVIPPRTPSLQH